MCLDTKVTASSECSAMGIFQRDAVTVCLVMYSNAIYMFENFHSMYAQSAEMLSCMIEKLMILKLQTHT